MTSPAEPVLKSSARSFGGWVKFFTHPSEACNGDMSFSVYLPPAADTQSVPTLYWLSGLTCTEENFMIKAGAQQFAAEHGVMIVAPDTSPRGAGVAGEDDDYDFGTGAGFYVNATTPGWSDNYHMYDYVTRELPALVAAHFPVATDRQGVFGHSMGGHGALVVGLRNPDVYRSISAFSPIVAPSQCPWGRKALAGYLGDNEDDWKAYDATALVGQAEVKTPILIDQGSDDQFLVEQLKPELFEAACRECDYPVTVRMQSGYDHSYYFIATFVGDHLEHHARALKA